MKTYDESGAVDRIRADTNMVFIHFLVKHRFDSLQSQQRFDGFYDSFKSRHCFDVHQTYTFGYTLPGLIERKAFYAGELGCNYSLWFHLCGLCGLLWPYSLCVESKISRFVVVSMKVVTI